MNYCRYIGDHCKFNNNCENCEHNGNLESASNAAKFDAVLAVEHILRNFSKYERGKILQSVSEYFSECAANLLNLEDATPTESITTKGGMTLSLKKTDIEISNLARCIASALKDITVEEFANKYSMLTIADNNSGRSVSYCRVDNGEEAEND